MVGERERGEGDVGFLSCGDAGCGNARQPGNQITDHSARCQPWLIFHSTTRSGSSGLRRAPGLQGCGHSATRRKTRARPTCPPVFFPSARGRELSLGEKDVEIKRARIGKAGTHFSHWVHRFHKRGGLRFCPGNGRTPAWIHVCVAEGGPFASQLPKSRPAS